MSYPSSIANFVTKIDKNASGWYVSPEYFNVPTSTPYETYLDHVPNTAATTIIGASGGAAWTQVYVAPTAVSQYLVDYTTGKVTFYSGNAGAAVYASYYNLGDDVMAEHMNLLQTEVTSIESSLGIWPEKNYSTVAARLNAMDVSIGASGFNGQRITDNTVRAGALRSDIKGAGWDSVGRPTLQDIYTHIVDPTDAHDASAISATDPGGGWVQSVQDHINMIGAGVISSGNPHGTGYGDIAIWYGMTIGNIDSSGTYMPITSAGLPASGSAGGRDIGSSNSPLASGCFDKVYTKEITYGGDEVKFFSNDTIADDRDGKSVMIYRKATEGTNYLKMYVDDAQGSNIYADTLLVAEANTDIFLRVGSGRDVFVGDSGWSNFSIGSSWQWLGSPPRPKLYQYGYITAAGANKYIQWQVNDDDDYFTLDRQDANILGLQINMPTDHAGNITTNASGTYSIGSVTAPFSEVSAKRIRANDDGFSISNANGADGTFTTNDGKTVTVRGGIITSIV